MSNKKFTMVVLLSRTVQRGNSFLIKNYKNKMLHSNRRNISCIYFDCSSIDVGQPSPHSKDTSVVCLLRNNQIEMVSATTSQSQPEFVRSKSISSQGHRGECRSTCFSSDALALVTTSAESVKLWSR